MPSDAIRNLGYFAWKNNLSWMERQKGLQWDNTIENENNNFKEELKDLKISHYNPPSDETTLKGWTISSEPFSPEQTWKKNFFRCKCWDADFSDKLFVAGVQDNDGYERFSVQVYKIISINKISHLKTIHQTGSSVAILNNTIWFLGSDNDLRYNKVQSWQENSEIKTHYTSEDLEENLEIKRGEDGSVYVIKGTYVKKQYALVNSLDTWLDTPDLKSCIVSDSLKLPGIEDTIEALSFKAGWVVSRSRGIRTLWKMKNDEVKPITWIWGDISSDTRNPYKLDISDIRYNSYSIHLPKWILTNPKPHLFPCSYHEHPLPAFVVHPQDIQQIKGLLITAYGAYGIPTKVGSLISRWKPLLEKGWIVVSVMVPGSGDDDISWVREGQRLNRLKSIELFKESIEALKEEYGVDSSKVALYGRSAGGLLVSSVAILNPGLVGALYLESPYVDILRTMTNPELPLTTLETSEFGSDKDPIDVLTTAEWSPMEHIPNEGIPELFVIARTDTNDLEVFPYEILKFIKRLRGKDNGYKKLVFIHKGKGHFTTSWKSRAEDISLLDDWIEMSPDKKSKVRTNNIQYKYNTMAPSRKNRATRKNRKDRKDRKSRKDRKNRNRK